VNAIHCPMDVIVVRPVPCDAHYFAYDYRHHQVPVSRGPIKPSPSACLDACTQRTSLQRDFERIVQFSSLRVVTGFL